MDNSLEADVMRTADLEAALKHLLKLNETALNALVGLRAHDGPQTDVKGIDPEVRRKVLSDLSDASNEVGLWLKARGLRSAPVADAKAWTHQLAHDASLRVQQYTGALPQTVYAPMTFAIQAALSVRVPKGVDTASDEAWARALAADASSRVAKNTGGDQSALHRPILEAVQEAMPNAFQSEVDDEPSSPCM